MSWSKSSPSWEQKTLRKADAFLFFIAARYAALVFFTSNAEGRVGLSIGVGAGVEEIGVVSSGTTDVVILTCSVSSGAASDALAGLTYSSGATLVVALAISSAAGIASSALVLSVSSVA